MHLADAFIQSDLVYNFFCQYMCSLGIEPTTFALLMQFSNHWATGTWDSGTETQEQVKGVIWCDFKFCFLFVLLQADGA